MVWVCGIYNLTARANKTLSVSMVSGCLCGTGPCKMLSGRGLKIETIRVATRYLVS
ncbi:hypothetical protein M407DRAFT_130673 [Tulasnella calospora MUT 4182]|uniref:Uncharacterized protein n=1 Tax=Tulasnella calospora MUT 4182 TaxID=1051891 RepID=A0A0C3Q994_9AGAM|nr:hypothetical protein M407DRAFT_130673 [Tulasnella calospora MUT 4182]